MLTPEIPLSRINSERLRDRLWRLVQIASPTGREKKAAGMFVELLEQAGAQVVVDDRLPDSPNVIGRLKGNKPGPTIQLAGHLDHIDIAHPVAELHLDRVIGRGAADMKNGLAGILEIVQILHDTGCEFPGEILITAYGLHEAPVGNSKGLLNLLEAGIKGDAAIVFEGPSDVAAVMANGMAIWNLGITHAAPASHELCTDRDKYELLEWASHVVTVFKQADLEKKQRLNPFPLLPAESIFVGQFHYGDFYNRLTNQCVLQGTRRWQPDKTFDEIKVELESVIQHEINSNDITYKQDWMLVGESYEISPDEFIVQCLQQAYETVTGRPLAIKGHSSVTDACRLVSQGHIPTVLCGFGTETGHADFEYVTVEQIVTSCRIAFMTVWYYLHQYVRREPI